MKWSVVDFLKLQEWQRIDPDYYMPEFIELEATFKNKKIEALETFCNFCKKGIFDISPTLYKQTGVPLIRTSEIKDPLIDFSTTVYLDSQTHKYHKKTQLIPGDIVFTKIGAYIGDIAVLPKVYSQYNFSQNVAGISLKQEKIKPGYLLAYLLSGFGKKQITRVAMLSGQGKIELQDIKSRNYLAPPR